MRDLPRPLAILRACVITTAYALSALGLALLALDWHLRDALAAQERPIALCPNWTETIVYPTPWEAAHGRKVRTIPAPPCEELK